MPEEILLVNPPFGVETSIKEKSLAPLGIASIAAYLIKSGYNIQIIDGHYLERKYSFFKSIEKINQEIKRESPFAVASSLFYNTEYIVRKIFTTAKHEGAYTIAGGYTATLENERIARIPIENDIKNPLVDIVVRRDGEITTKELIDALFNGDKLNKIQGITFFDGEKIIKTPDRDPVDLNKIPPPALDLLSSELYFPTIEATRGCIFNCSFCSINAQYPFKPRYKSIERIEEEAKMQKGVPGMDIMNIAGELVLTQTDYAEEIAKIMEKFDYKWMITAHPTLVVKEKKILSELSKKGLETIGMGIESANQDSLNIFNKKTTRKINEKAIEICLKANINPCIYFINFQPYMSMSNLKENIQFLRTYSELIGFYGISVEDFFKKWIPISGTRLFEEAYKDNLIIKLPFAEYTFESINDQIRTVMELYIDYFYCKYRNVLFDALHKLEKNTKENQGVSNKSTGSIFSLLTDILILSYVVAENNMDKQKAKSIIDLISEKYFKKCGLNIEFDETEASPKDIYEITEAIKNF